MTTRSQSATRVRIATTIVVPLALVLAVALAAHAADVPNCNANGAATPCFEQVWVDGAQLEMTFVDDGISSGACVPTMTETPQGIVPFARTVNEHGLTSVDGIESAADSGFVTLVDTASVFIARVDSNDKPRGCD